MGEGLEQDPGGDIDAEVWNAILAFEKILEAMPDDRPSLEALSHAYEQIGDHTKAKEHLLRLGKLLADERDIDMALELAERLRPYAEEDPEVASLVSLIEKLASGEINGLLATDLSEELTGTGPRDGVRMTFDMADELAFAWNLLGGGKLTQEEYASVVQDLTEMSAVETATTVSVLHVLEARGFKNLEKIICFAAEECGMPVISLSSFELRRDVAIMLPEEFMVRRGAIVFDVLAKHVLAVVMNPYNKQIQKDVELLSGHRCHFYMAVPVEFDRSLEKLVEMASKDEDAPEKGA